MNLEQEIKTTHFQSPQHKALLNILFTGYWLSDRVNSALKPFGISDQQYNVLRILRGQKGKPINLFHIQDRMLHRMSNATRLVEKLRLKGYVERILCESNRRKVEISITQKGLRLLEKIEASAAIKKNAPWENISKADAVKLSKILDRIRT